LALREEVHEHETQTPIQGSKEQYKENYDAFIINSLNNRSYRIHNIIISYQGAMMKRSKQK